MSSESGSPSSLSKGIKGIVEAFQTPISLIGFLAVSIVFALWKIIPASGTIWSDVRAVSSIILIGLLSVIVLVVCFLTIFCPDKLIYDKEASLRDKGKPPFFGTETHPTKNNNKTPRTPRK